MDEAKSFDDDKPAGQNERTVLWQWKQERIFLTDKSRIYW